MPAAPKHPSTRARRNVVSTKATLRAAADLEVPSLPLHPGGDEGQDWHPLTVRWWSDVWSSPMGPEYDSSDVHGLFALAVLTDDFWRASSPSARTVLAAELRQQSQRFGLSPLDRRRLQWEIERTDEAQAKGAKRRGGASAPEEVAADPRSVLAG